LFLSLFENGQNRTQPTPNLMRNLLARRRAIIGSSSTARTTVFPVALPVIHQTPAFYHVTSSLLHSFHITTKNLSINYIQ